jgi:hypothetical protein
MLGIPRPVEQGAPDERLSSALSSGSLNRDGRFLNSYHFEQEIIMYLQALPTQDWTDDTVRVLLSEAYVLMRVWQDADAHFSGK